MKRGFYILLIMCTAIMVVSCDKTKSYTDMLKAQEKAIDRLRADSGLVFLEEFPTDSIFKENEFVKLDNDVYLNVIDSGNGNRAVLGTTKVFCRFEAKGILDSDTAYNMVNNLTYGPGYYGFPTEFVFGYNVYSGESRSYDPDLFVGEGLATALYHVGEGATVRMIVPFKRMGNYFQSSYVPVYFSKVKYTFEK